MRTILRPLPLLLSVLAACSGSQNPPPPVATATPGRSADAVEPMSSRESSATPASPSSGAMPGGAAASPSLPPGHPPLGGTDPHGNLAAGGAAKSAGSITGTIHLAPKLQVGPKDVLYVMAKKGASTLAVRRIESPKFPLSFEISGGDAMTAGVAFEGPVDVVARVSRTGDAIPAKGDLEGTAKNVKVPAKAVSLTIDSVRQ